MCVGTGQSHKLLLGASCPFPASGKHLRALRLQGEVLALLSQSWASQRTEHQHGWAQAEQVLVGEILMNINHLSAPPEPQSAQ